MVPQHPQERAARPQVLVLVEIQAPQQERRVIPTRAHEEAVRHLPQRRRVPVACQRAKQRADLAVHLGAISVQPHLGQPGQELLGFLPDWVIDVTVFRREGVARRVDQVLEQERRVVVLRLLPAEQLEGAPQQRVRLVVRVEIRAPQEPLVLFLLRVARLLGLGVRVGGRRSGSRDTGRHPGLAARRAGPEQPDGEDREAEQHAPDAASTAGVEATRHDAPPEQTPPVVRVRPSVPTVL